MIIAVDGHAAAGKGALSRRLAEAYGLSYMDTGLLYRAVARSLLDQGLDPADEAHALCAAQALDPTRLEEMSLRGADIGEAASLSAAIPSVRAALIAFQRCFAQSAPGAVLDGRDIGTTVCPEAHVKFFVTASLEERTRRRFLELTARGERISLEEVQEGLFRRDQRDAERVSSPFRPAPGAFLLDTTESDIGETFRVAASVVEKAARALGWPASQAMGP